MTRTAKALLLSLAMHVCVLVALGVGSAWRASKVPKRPTLAYVRLVAPPRRLVWPSLGDGPGGTPALASSRTSVSPRKPATRSARPTSVALQPQPAPPAVAPPSHGEPAQPTPAGTGEAVAASAPPGAPGAGSSFLPEALASELRMGGAEPAFPSALVRAGVTHIVQAKLCVTTEGNVDRVSLLRSADPALEASITTAVRTWRYRPRLINGKPAPFCTFVRFEFRGE